MISKKLTIGSVNASDYGVYCTDAGVYSSPSPVYDTYEINGRNGALHVDKGRYSNVTVKYQCVIPSNFQSNFKAFRGAILAQKGNQRIEDEFDEEVYRMGILSDSIDGNVGVDRTIGTFDLTFSCMPQKFLKSGEQTKTYTANATISNPTVFESKPLIRVYGVGKVEIGSETITVAKGATSYIDIDCDIQDCYEGLTNRNSLVTLTDFPTLKSGDNGIKLGTGITKVEITPRWWML